MGSLRTALYAEILISYFSYVRERGFAFGFIWACPPSKGDDYILHCKPESQKTPNNTRLQKWYQDMLDISEERGLIYSTSSFWDTYLARKVDPYEKILLGDIAGTQSSVGVGRAQQQKKTSGGGGTKGKKSAGNTT